jgi:hypothetical protein
LKIVEPLKISLQSFEIEVKTVTPAEYASEKRIYGWKILKRNTKIQWDKEKKYGHEVGTITIGIYTELRKLYEEQFEANWMKWKKEYNLTDDEWTEVGDTLRILMETGSTPTKISDFLKDHTLSKTHKGRKIPESIRNSTRAT